MIHLSSSYYSESPLFYVEYTAMAIENRTVVYVGFADNLADVTKQVCIHQIIIFNSYD